MTPAPTREHLYLDDLYVGLRAVSGTYQIDVEGIKAFGAQFDPQPFHLDEAAADASLFRGLAASGWHTAAVTMRLTVLGGIPIAGGVVGFGAELDWPRPTRPGDTLHIESEIIEIIPSRSKPNQGLVKVRITTLNQNGEPVQILTAKLLAFKRPVEATPAAKP